MKTTIFSVLALFFCIFYHTCVWANHSTPSTTINSENDALLASIYIQFDLKVVVPPSTPNAQWRIKLETSDIETAVELPIVADVEYGQGPVVGQWRTFRFDMLTIARAGTDIDLDAIEKVLIFPKWGSGADAVYRIDNAYFVAEDSREALFVDNELSAWPLWDCCAKSVPSIVTDSDGQGNAIEFTIVNDNQGTVLGFNRNANVKQLPFKLSSLSINTAALVTEKFVSVTPTPDTTLYFDHILSKEMTSLGTLYAIVKDNQGFLWLGGSDGLARFDGYTLKNYKHDRDNPNSLSNNTVWDMLIDKTGRLWVATESGLNVFNQATQQFQRYIHNPNDDNSLSFNTAKALFEDSQGNIWVGTYGGGVNRISADGQQFIRYQHDDTDSTSISSNEVNAIKEDNQGRIWIGTDKGLNRYDPKTNTFARYFSYWGDQSSLTDSTILTMETDELNRLWIGTYGGLNLFDTNTGEVTRFRFEGTKVTDVVALAFDKNNQLFVGTGDGLIVFDPTQLTYTKYIDNPLIDSSFEGKYPASLFNDGENWWLGAFPVGINYIDHNKNLFTTFESQPNVESSLSHNSILTITEDSKGNLWLGTDGGGLNYYDRKDGSFKQYLHAESDTRSINGNAVLSTTFDTNGNLWISSWHAPVSILNPQTGEFIHETNTQNGHPVPDSLFVWNMLTDSRGDIWFATLGNGLLRYDYRNKDYLSYFTDESDLSGFGANVVWSVFEDSKQQMWFGTSDGLERFIAEENRFVRYQYDENNPQSLSNNIVLSINEDANGKLWIGTRGGGLNRFDPDTETFTAFTEKDGLPDDVITAILSADEKHLWLSSFNGLCHFDLVSEKCRNYRNIGGMQTSKFNIDSALALSSGELAFGGIGGFTLFNPASIQQNATIPPVVFTDFQVANRSVIIGEANSPLSEDISLTSSVTLDHTQSMFSIEFSALDYQAPEENQYAYFLEGYDEQWNTIGNRRRATYTNLDPGNYRFLVNGSNGAGIWNPEPTSVDITVLAPPWRSWWAYSLYILIVVSITALIVYLQYKKLQERNQLKLALWASGDEMWDIDLTKQQVSRLNKFDFLASSHKDAWVLSNFENTNIHPDDQEKVRRALADHFNNKDGYFEVTYRAKSRDGEWVWMLDRGMVTSRNKTGSPNRFSGTTKNIQQLKTAESDLRSLNRELEQRVEERTLELQQSNEYLKNTQAQLVESEKRASLATVVIGVSHELNTPAGIGITAVSHLKYELNQLVEQVEKRQLSVEHFNKFKDSALASIDLIDSSFTRSVSIIQSFKEISVDHGKYQLKTRILRQFIEQVVAAVFGASTGDSDHKVTISCDATLQFNTYFDILSSTLTQLLTNVKQHAFTEEATLSVQVRVLADINNLTIEIEDDGKGMSSDALTKLFDPFFTTDRGQNVGLGMFVVYNQVYNLLNGSIKCESALGEGTRFTLTLPLVQI